MVPKQAKSVAKPKPRKRIKATSSELEWLADEETVVDTSVKQPVEAPPERVTTPASIDTSSQNEWQSPQQVIASDSITETQPNHSEQTRQAAVPNPLFPEPENADIPDWRDGASEDELRQFGVLQDSNSMPQLQDSWNIDEGVSDLKQDTSVVRKPRAKAKSRASSSKKVPKKAPTRSSTKKK
jgi:hypothetical protein